MRVIIIILILWVVTASCNNQTQSSGNRTEKMQAAPAGDSDVVVLSAGQIKNAGIITGAMEQKEMHSILRVNGVIDVPPQNIISVSLPPGGYLKRMDLIPGQKVTKGSVLATFEDQQYIQLQQDFLTAESKLEFAAADYNRQKGLNETKSTSDKVFQQAKSDYESQKILVRSLAEKLRLIGIMPEKLTDENISRAINIYSPISGFVTKVNVNIGKYVSPADVLFELINPDDLHVRLTVFENDAANLSVGQKIKFTVNHSTEEHSASIHLITPNIDDNHATAVHCHVEGAATKLFPGTFVNAAIQLNNAKVTAVPQEAVVKWESKYFVFCEVGENRFKLTPVETGADNDGFIEIKTALPAKNIVVKNAYIILMKMKNGGEEG